jgi:predicted Zn-dependent protease
MGSAAAALFLTCLPAAAADNRTPGSQPAPDSVEAGILHYAGLQENALRSSPARVRDQALNNYIGKFVCDLAGPRCAEIRIYIVNRSDFNAGTYPNGAMEIWTGLLLRVENEAQLAFVLGHELTHFENRHALKRFESERDTAGALAVFSVLTAQATYGLAGDLAGIGAAGGLLSYSRAQEAEADNGGFDLAVAHGYDPRQAAAIWQALSEEKNSNPKPDRTMLFFRDHPTDAARITAMTRRADQITQMTHADGLGVEAFRAATLPHRAQWLDQELGRAQFDESLTLMARLLKSDPESAELKYFQAEAFRRRNGKGDIERALAAYKSVTGKSGAPVSAYRGLGLVALKSGEKDTAREAFRNYLDAAPNADDRQIIQFYLMQLGG